MKVKRTKTVAVTPKRRGLLKKGKMMAWLKKKALETKAL